jgi:predicted permease
MGVLQALFARIRAIARRDAIAGEIHDELRFHVDSRVEQYEREGLTRDEATRKARARIGNVAVHQDRGYDVRGGGVMETIWQDVRYSLRLLARQRGFALVAIVTLALGIGASTAIFSVIDAAILRPLAYPHPEELVEVSVEFAQPDGRSIRLGPSYTDMIGWQDTGVFSAIATSRNVAFGRILDAEQPERLDAGEMSLEYLKVFGVAPILGRSLSPDDMTPGAPGVVLLSYNYWRSHFGGTSSVVGQSMRFDDGSATIVGVLPARFESGMAIWRPVQIADPDQRGSGRSTYARLPPGLTRELAEERLAAAMPPGPDGRPLKMAVRLQSMLDDTRSGYRTTVNILAGAVGAILLIACVNVAGLLLARGATRQSELAVRASIGAGRGRLIRQLLTESVVLSLAGGLVGALVAWISLNALVANIPIVLSADVAPTMNLRVLAAAIGLTVLTGLLFGLAPALRLSRVTLGATLARGNRRQGSALTRRGGQLLIAVEVALAVVLVAGAALMVRSFAKILSVDLGFNPDAIVTMKVTPLNPDPAVFGQYCTELLRNLRQIPGVAAAGGIDNGLLLTSASSTRFIVEGRANGTSAMDFFSQVLPGFFQAIGVAPLHGDLPSETNVVSGRNVLTINETAARTWFPDGRAVGRQVIRPGRVPETWEVGAVVPDVREGGPLSVPRVTVYTPFRPSADRFAQTRGMTIVVRTNGEIPGLADVLRRTALSVGPRVLVEAVRTGNDLFSQKVIRPRQRTVLLSLLGGLGLALALVGVFGMTAYAVARRTQEIGVRMAFGARAGQVVATMVRDSAWPIVIGTIAGLGGAALATKLIASFLFQTTPTDPGTFAAVAVTLAVAGCLAAWIPARRAARVDPVSALRAE